MARAREGDRLRLTAVRNSWRAGGTVGAGLAWGSSRLVGHAAARGPL